MQIGAFDFGKIHIVKRPDGSLELYERRRTRIVTNSCGKPKRVIPDGVEFSSWHRLMDKGDRVAETYVLIPLNIAPST